MTISIGDYFSDNPFLYDISLSHIITNYNGRIVIWDGRHTYGSMVMIHIHIP